MPRRSPGPRAIGHRLFGHRAPDRGAAPRLLPIGARRALDQTAARAVVCGGNRARKEAARAAAVREAAIVEQRVASARIALWSHPAASVAEAEGDFPGLSLSEADFRAWTVDLGENLSVAYAWLNRRGAQLERWREIGVDALGLLQRFRLAAPGATVPLEMVLETGGLDRYRSLVERVESEARRDAETLRLSWCWFCAGPTVGDTPPYILTLCRSEQGRWETCEVRIPYCGGCRREHAKNWLFNCAMSAMTAIITISTLIIIYSMGFEFAVNIICPFYAFIPLFLYMWKDVLDQPPKPRSHSKNYPDLKRRLAYGWKPGVPPKGGTI